MALTRLRFERFTAFEQLDVGLSPGINVPVLHRGQVFIFGVLKSRKGNSFRFMSRHAALQSCCAETDRRALLAQYKKRNVADKLLTLRKQRNEGHPNGRIYCDEICNLEHDRQEVMI